VEPADHHHDTPFAQRTGDVERARELDRLNANQHHHSAPGGLDHARQALRVDARVVLVVGVQLDVDVVAEDAPAGTITGETEKRRERVRGNG